MVEILIGGLLVLTGWFVYGEYKSDKNRKEEGLDRLD